MASGRRRAVADFHVQRWGQGPEVLLVHGGVLNGEMLWSEQRPLAERWTLVVPDRRGYWPNPAIDREDFAVDAEDMADLLSQGVGGGMHLVGQSYGGLIALLAAAWRPEAVRSLTVCEPSAFDLVRGHPGVEAWVAEATELWTNTDRDLATFMSLFPKLVGSAAAPLPDPLPPPLHQHAVLLRHLRVPWEAQIPADRLRAAPFPKLVISGGHGATFEAVCDALEHGLGAERAVITGNGHTVPRIGAAFNERLEQFLQQAEARASQH
jgi:pimeloyl-ACP methyl ester carboxylesterase